MKYDLLWSRVALAIVAVAISLMGYGFPAAAEERLMIYIEEQTIESTNPSEEVQFDHEFNDGIYQYHLLGVKKQVIDSWPEVEAVEIEQNYDPIYDTDSAEEDLPPVEIVKDGIPYYLISREPITETVEARSEYGKAEIRYDDLEYIDELPDQGKVTITDSVTGKEYTRELPRSGYRVVSEQWKEGFSFDIIIYSYDADFYLLESLEIPKGSDLSQYGQEFLEYLGLDSNHYRIDSIALSGDPYEMDEELVQNAIARGSKRTVAVVATYEGIVSIPGGERNYYQCTYSNIPAGEKIPMLYKIKATATYEQVKLPEETKSVPNNWVSWLKNLLKEHASDILVVLLVLAFVLIVLRILMKRRKKDDKSNQTKSSKNKKQRDRDLK